jgi:hypothetical protein
MPKQCDRRRVNAISRMRQPRKGSAMGVHSFEVLALRWCHRRRHAGSPSMSRRMASWIWWLPNTSSRRRHGIRPTTRSTSRSSAGHLLSSRPARTATVPRDLRAPRLRHGGRTASGTFADWNPQCHASNGRGSRRRRKDGWRGEVFMPASRARAGPVLHPHPGPQSLIMSAASFAAEPKRAHRTTAEFHPAPSAVGLASYVAPDQPGPFR